MSSRSAAVVSLLVLLTALAALAVVFVPWQPNEVPASGPATADATTDFSAAEIARGDEVSGRLRVPGYLSLAAGVITLGVLGFGPWGARLVEAVARPLGGAWWVQVLVGGLAVLLVVRLVTLGFAVWSERVRLDVGLSTRSWGGWAVDVVKGFAVNSVMTLLVLLLLVAVVRRFPEWWWAFAAVGAVIVVVVTSFLYPLLVEPVFNKFTSMPEGELRTSLLELAERDGVAVDDVLIADASRRTSTLNAYVSGFGSTRRIVVYDNLLEQAPAEEIRNVVAHELGHAAERDVLVGTLLGALGAAAAMVALFLLLAYSPLLGYSGASGMGDGRVVALVLALVSVATLLLAPVQSLISRKIEARADVHALDLTRDAQTFTQMQRRLALTSKSDLTPNPVLFAWFGSHPSTAQRMAAARNWALANDEPVPPGLAPTGDGATAP